MKDIRQALNNLPEGLQETYENILEKVTTGCVDIVKQTLQWLVCDVTTLTLAELYECLAIEQDMDHIDEEAQLSSPMDIYDLCGSLISVTAEGGVILAHLSVKDYLLSDAIKHGKASTFALSLPEVNAENASKCLTYLSFAEFRTGPSRTQDDFGNRLFAHPFLCHASMWWPTYAKNASSSSEELKSRVLEFFTPSCRTQFMSWLQVICSEIVIFRQDLKRTGIERRKRGFSYYPRHATSLYYAASFGIEYVVRALLEQGAEVDAKGGRLEATAFHAAALRGHVKIMDILYQKGADPNMMDRIMKTPLNSAALVDNVEVIKYLLEHDADPNIADDRQKTPYDWACMMGHVEAQKLLKPVTWVDDSAEDATKFFSNE
jgi:Ankyrin repeats (3 copies)/Ankyrin repeats (many copies)